MNPDFSLLHSQLRLPPDCTLEEFKRAYRRRVGELHPDRKGGTPPSTESQAALQALYSTYVAVSRFHRRYGRMPGAMDRTGSDARRSRSSEFALPIPTARGNESEPRSWPAWLLVLILLGLALIASWDWLALMSQ